MLEVFLSILQPQILLFMSLAVVCGLLIGAIPGLSATMAMALLTPLTFAMESKTAFSILCAVYIGSVSGGFYSAILLKIPGTSSSIATTFDGYPMAQQGKSGKAIGVALIGSFVGGSISFLLLLLFAPILANVALRFGPAEYAALALLGLSTIAAVVGNSTVKGLLSAVFGLSLSTVGLDVIMGSPRFTAGRMELLSGFDVLIVMIGLFAIPQILRDVCNPEKIKVNADTSFREMLPSFSYLKTQIINFIRSSLIGSWIGLLPGAGGSIASLLSYDQAKKGSKNPEKFGAGIEDGIIASETANNAVIGGSLIPMLTLGIPGDTPAAVLLAAFTLHGLQAGPLLYKQSPQIVDLILSSLFISNILMVCLAFLGARYLVKALECPKKYLAPIIIIMCIIGAYSANQRPSDIGIMLVLGIIGFFLERFCFPASPLVLGVILGPLLEKNFRRAVQVSNDGILGIVTRPITAVILVIVLLNFSKPVITSLIRTVKKRNKTKQDAGSKDMHRINRLWGIAFIILGLGYYWQATKLTGSVMGGKAYGPDFYPKIMAILIIFLSIALVVLKPQVKDRKDPTIIHFKVLLSSVTVLLIYPVLIQYFGFLISTFLFLNISFIYLGKDLTRKSVLFSFLISSATVVVLYYLFERVFMIPLPCGILF